MTSSILLSVYVDVHPDEKNDFNISEVLLSSNRTNKPVVRQYVILDAIKKSFKESESMVTYFNLSQFPVEILKKTHNTDYLFFLQNAYSNAQEHNDFHWFNDDELIPLTFFSKTNSMLDEASLKQKIPLYKLSGLYCQDYMTPICSKTYLQATRP